MVKDITIVIIGIALAALIFVFWDQFTAWRINMYGGGERPVACTADAKRCPDGVYVGRTGPNCEFVCSGE